MMILLCKNDDKNKNMNSEQKKMNSGNKEEREERKKRKGINELGYKKKR